ALRHRRHAPRARVPQHLVLDPGSRVSIQHGRLSWMELLERIEAHIRRHDLVAPGGEVLCLVSGGADSTCLFHALRELGYSVSALHVNYALRGCESDDAARFC